MTQNDQKTIQNVTHHLVFILKIAGCNARCELFSFQVRFVKVAIGPLLRPVLIVDAFESEAMIYPLIIKEIDSFLRCLQAIFSYPVNWSNKSNPFLGTSQLGTATSRALPK